LLATNLTNNGTLLFSRSAADLALNIPRMVGWLDNGDGSLAAAFAAPGDTNIDCSVDILDAADFLSTGLLAAYQHFPDSLRSVMAAILAMSVAG
jgi:hypothetical protein